MTQYAHQTEFGAQILDQNHTRFALWAPDSEQVQLETPDGKRFAMTRTDDGFHRCTAPLNHGDAYQFRVTEDLRVPDPASRQQQDDVHGPSLVVDPQRFEWRYADWKGRPWQSMVIYELHLGCYGGFTEVESHLAHLVDMGFTAIELMPIADFSGQRNWGYDGVLPYAPDSSYGTPEQLKHLVDTAHGLGLCVYLDVVYNHFGPDGNYLHTYASRFFSPDESSPWGAAIDFTQPVVREFFTQNAIYWLMEYRFDGLRFDAVHAIMDQSWLPEMAAKIKKAIEPDRQVHLMLENERNVSQLLEQDFNAQWNDDIHNVIHRLLTGENEGYYRNYDLAPTEKLAKALVEGFVYQGEASPTHDNAPRGTPSKHLSPDHFIFFLQNHDQVGNRAFGDRLTTLVEPNALRAAVTVQLLSPHIPLVFMGEERGLTTPFLFFTDFHGELAQAVREGRRAEFAAFSHFASSHDGGTSEVQSTIPDPNLPETFERSRKGIAHFGAPNKAGEWEDFYRKLLSLRHRHITPHLSSAKGISSEVPGEACVVATWALADERKLTMIINLGSAEYKIPPPAGEWICESRPSAADKALSGKAMGQATSVWLG